MPIRPEMKALYPPEWTLISDYIRFDRAMGRCECRGECGSRLHAAWTYKVIPWPEPIQPLRCPNYHGDQSRFTGAKVILTTAHLDHDPGKCDPEDLRAFCQACHLAYDKDHHAATRAATRKARQMTTPEEDTNDYNASHLPAVPALTDDGHAAAWLGVDAWRWTALFLDKTGLANAGPDFVHTVHGWFCNAIGAGQSSMASPFGHDEDPATPAAQWHSAKASFHERLLGWTAEGINDGPTLTTNFRGSNGEVGSAIWLKETGILQYDILRAWLGQDEHDQTTRVRVARTLHQLYDGTGGYVSWDDLDETTQNDWIEQAGIVIRAQRGKCSCVKSGPDPEMDEWCPQHGRGSA